MAIPGPIPIPPNEELLKDCMELPPPNPPSSWSNSDPPNPIPNPGMPNPNPPNDPKGDIWFWFRRGCRITRLVPGRWCRPIMPNPPNGSANGSIMSLNGSLPPKNSRKISKGSRKANEGKPKANSSSNSLLRWRLFLPEGRPLFGARPSFPYLS